MCVCYVVLTPFIGKQVVLASLHELCAAQVPVLSEGETRGRGKDTKYVKNDNGYAFERPAWPHFPDVS